MASYDSAETPSPSSELYHSACDSNEDLRAIPVRDGLKLDLPSTAIDFMNSTLFSGIILAVWDNIMGPRVRRLWISNESNFKIEQEMINYVCNHTLNGELTRIGKEGVIDTKFYCLKDRGYIFTSSVFSGRSKNGQTVWSVSVVLAYAQLDRYLTLQHFISLQVKALVMKCRILQEKDIGKLPAAFSPHVCRFVSTMESLQVSGLPDVLCVKETYFGNHEFSPGSGSVTTKFFMCAITSHLQTGGSSVVIGLSEFLVNVMVTTLAQFLSASERACCRYTDSRHSYDFSRDFFVQAVLRSPGASGLPFTGKDVILSAYPCTVIDMDSREVSQTPLFHNHSKMRTEFMKIELSLLLRGQDAPVYPTMGLFTPCEQIATMVQHCVSEISLLPNLCSVREVYVQHFVGVLRQRANALLAYTEAASKRGTIMLGHSEVRQMRQDLDLTSEADFHIVLAWTEKACPGICSFLLGDTRQNAATMQANDMMLRTPVWK